MMRSLYYRKTAKVKHSQANINNLITYSAPINMRYSYAFVATAALILTSPSCVSAHLPSTHDFREVHSYPASSAFDPRDGWKRVTITDLPYKYPNQTASAAEQTAGIVSHRRGHRSTFGRVFDRRASKAKSSAKTAKKKTSASNKSKAKTTGGGLLDQALTGIGKATSVVITW